MFSHNKVPRMQSSEEGPGYTSSSDVRMSMSAQAPVVPAQHGYPIVQYVGGREAFFFYNQGSPLYRQGGGGGYFDSQAESQVTANVVSSEENDQRSPGIASHKSSHHNSHLIWLKDNLDITREGSLSRLSLYEGYVHHCREQKLEPLNQPSFGKLIHSVFPKIKARRLGTRGNSRYHYYGIRVKPNSPLSKLQEDPLYNATGQQPIKQEQGVTDCMSDQPGGVPERAPEQLEAAQSQFTQMSRELPPFPNLDHLRRQPLLMEKLQTLYRKNCVAVLDVVKNLQFHCVENLWQSFWCPTVASSDGSTDIPNSTDALEGMIPRDSLLALCKYDDVRVWMRSCDRILYEAMVEFLIPNVVCQVPIDRIRDMRDFANNVEGWMTKAMRDFFQEVVCSKVEAVRAFAQMLRQYISLNDLAQAARSHLQKTSTVNKMIADLDKVDFANIQKQASWVCQCDEGVFRRVEQNFKATLTQQGSGDQWATWLDAVVSQVLHDKGLEDARQFLLKWTYYSSMVVRDLTLRSAATYGPCHVVCMFYDEYMLYLVQRHVAKVTKQPAIAVIGEFNDLSCTPGTSKRPVL